MSVSLAEICENTKMGRECALLGSYDSAQVYYQAVLQQIQKLLLTNDATSKQKWQQVGSYLNLSFSMFCMFYSLFVSLHVWFCFIECCMYLHGRICVALCMYVSSFISKKSVCM